MAAVMREVTRGRVEVFVAGVGVGDGVHLGLRVLW